MPTPSLIASAHIKTYLQSGGAVFTLAPGGPAIPFRVAAPAIQDHGREVYFVRAKLDGEDAYLGYLKPAPGGALEARLSAKSATTRAAAEAWDKLLAVLQAVNGGGTTPYSLEHDGKCGRCRQPLDESSRYRGVHETACAPAPKRRGRPGYRPGVPPAGGTPTPTPSPSPSDNGDEDGTPDGDAPDAPDAEPTPDPKPVPPTVPPSGGTVPLTPAQASLARAYFAITASVGGRLTMAEAEQIARLALYKPAQG